jgi:cobaltochelatase CobT
MFTDGEPMDASTLSVQRGDFLQQHFRSVVKRIVSERKVMLKLIGINHDLSDVLFDAVRATESTLGDPVLKTIGNILDPA